MPCGQTYLNLTEGMTSIKRSLYLETNTNMKEEPKIMFRLISDTNLDFSQSFTRGLFVEGNDLKCPMCKDNIDDVYHYATGDCISTQSIFRKF